MACRRVWVLRGKYLDRHQCQRGPRDRGDPRGPIVTCQRGRRTNLEEEDSSEDTTDA